MLSNDLVNAFNDCIDRLAAGQSLEQCLRVYPQFAVELEPMLLAGQLAVRARPDAVEVDIAKNRQRGRFEQALRVTSMRGSSRRQMGVARVVGIAASFLLIFAILLTGTTVYAQRSLPGDRLYGLKLLSEDGRLLVAGVLGDKDGLETEFAARRITETRDLLDIGREETVAFEGVIASKQATPDGYTLVVADLTIAVSGENDRVPPFNGLQVGNRVRIEGRTTRDGNVSAIQIRLVGRRSNQNDRRDGPSPTPIIGPSPTSTPTERPTPTPTRAVDGINDQTPVPTRPLDVPTARPPTESPRGNGGDGGGNNDGGNDSDGGNDGGQGDGGDGRR